jgi:carboxyl-terminal processing protease
MAQMKNIFLWIGLILSTAALNTTWAAPLLSPLPPQLQTAHLSAEILTRHHYKKIPLNDASSAKIFDNYLKALDSEKVFFLQADIDHFAISRTQLDDAILNEDLSLPFAIYNLYQQRITERFTYARSLLSQGFQFELDETYQYSRKKVAWANSNEEINEWWRKRVKNDWLRLKLAGKDDKNITDTLGKRYDNFLSKINKIKSDDVFQSFMNAYATAIDPHTSYFGIRASEDFDISMKLSLVGIGAVLQDKDEYTTISELVVGGPAALSGKLKAGDRIVGVGQGAHSIPTDVMGWRIDDVVALIRGTEDSTVQLEILPAEANPDGKHKPIFLVRKKISLDKQAAKKSIIEVNDDGSTRHIGVITLPGFYLDFAARQKGDKDYRSATRDVSQLLAELKKDNVDSVLIDLRNNGGGSLDEAIELTGLFIDKGPVVQQRDSNGKIRVENDTHAGLTWSGPLGVLINRGSASASEIFAAAIQDYGRGIVIGAPSFGKGTVQTVINLDQLAGNSKSEFGELKMTVAQFFRINGGTTQLRGVTPDISLPSIADTEDFGESSYDNALPWTQIQAANYTPAGDLSDVVTLLKEKHNLRVSTDREFQYLLEDIAEFNNQRKKNVISLNEAERIKERDALNVRAKLREKERGVDTTKNPAPHDDGLQSAEGSLDGEEMTGITKNSAPDVLLNEAAHILGDETNLLISNPTLAVSALIKDNIR